MLTKNEITALSLSPTKKDFVQIWNELLEVAGKLSERWDPTSTNESDPGIVILKALTGIADKLNYNIDKNTLEAFMPTAAQEDSMRKLCDMLGYTMKYYRSAETTVNIKYYNAEPSEEETSVMASGVYIPKFTTITNSDQDISYFTTNQSPLLISSSNPNLTEVPCMEGQIVKCESIGGTNVITISHISENNRFYLPETQIAENGVFVYNVNNTAFEGTALADGTEWLRVDNLNTQAHGTRVFKFGYDSYEGRPYLEFPDDYSELFNDGLSIYYTRTSGAVGNISSKTLTQISLPSTDDWSKVSAASFSVENIFSATSGANPETIKQAYNNFKKTIGTFETLVTCRDYMNKIYSMIDEGTGKNLVSNILVTDIRNDLNKAITICSCDDAGIFYKETPKLVKKTKSMPIETVVNTKVTASASKPVYNGNTKSWHLGSTDGMKLAKTNFITSNSSAFESEADGVVLQSPTSDCWVIKQNDTLFTTNLKAIVDTEVNVNTTVEVDATQPAIDHFDLVFYPFKSYSQIKSNVKDIRAVYDTSFTYSDSKFTDISRRLEDAGIKNISHNIVLPSPGAKPGEPGDILSINNYLRLSATIATNAKVSEVERLVIIDNIKIALANAFNMHELDFGDEIPFDSIVEVIENADARIRVASLNEPALYTTFSVLETSVTGTPEVIEYAVASDWLDADMASATGRLSKIENYTDKNGNIGTRSVSTFNTKEAKQIYNRLAVRNVLAGRVPLFNYDDTFKASFSESAYQVTNIINPNVKPVELAVPTEEMPFTVLVDSETGAIYTGQLLLSDYEDFVGQPHQPVFKNKDQNADPSNPGESVDPSAPDVADTQIGIIIYTETRTPTEYDGIIKDNTIKENIVDSPVDDSTGADNTAHGTTTSASDYITSIKTDCKIFANENNKITDVTLADGEFVKFRAPNFTTVKTYPAYVNYRLELAKGLANEASSAKATAIYSALDNDDKWQNVLDYFRDNAPAYLRKFTLSQTVSAFKETDDKVQTSATVLELDFSNTPGENSEYTLADLFDLSGKVKLCNENLKARLAWTPTGNDSQPSSNIYDVIDIPPLTINSAFLENEGDLSAALTALNSEINSIASRAQEENGPKLPRECSWTIYFDFECVPFEVKAINAWETFIKSCAQSYSKQYQYQIFDFKPLAEDNTFLWRITEDTGYDIGKYITENSRKLLKFNKSYFTAVQPVPLKNLYIVEYFGADAKPTIIANNEEYTLGKNERLYIEYTPSSTSDSVSASSKNSITEVHGEGTIIRPNGFDEGLLDSAVYAARGNSATKAVTFNQVGNTPVNMFSFGASEQVEIRDLAKVEISRSSFGNASNVFIYKNFNNCPELESKDTDVNGERINNIYTLKDGEYIFYTDSNKSDFAYYTSGTQVTLSGNLILPEFDIIELSTIFDSGIQEIPWKNKQLEANDAISFQEFQYTTLGPGDTIKDMELFGTNYNTNPDGSVKNRFLDENWQYCYNANYTTATDPDTIVSLPTISVSGRSGNGWEACATLELDVTPNSAQTLRRTDKIETSLSISRTSTSGGSAGDFEIAPQVLTSSSIAGESLPMLFKTNVACQANGNSIDIDDIYYSSGDLNSFQLKVFAADAPSIVNVRKDTVVPFTKSGIVDFATWSGEQLTVDSDGNEIWTQLLLSKLSPAVDETSGELYDKALRLSINLLQDTYSIFCIYLDRIATNTNASVWIEALPGTEEDTITLLNSAKNAGLDSNNRLYLNTGINCIRVNKTGKIFIKAESGAEGVIYFDEPRLVTCKKLLYTNANNEVLPLYTSGLNLTQLGYLDASSDDSDKIDEATRAALHKAYINKASSELVSSTQLTHSELSADCNDLIKLTAKVQTIVDAEKMLKEELDNIQAIKKADQNRYNDLIDNYNTQKDILNKELALFEALKNNTKADDLETKLADLLSSFSSVETTQQQILEELDTLKTTATASIETISGARLLADYKESAEKVDLSSSFDEIREIAKENIEKSYQEQLTVLVNNLDLIVNADERNNLMAVLTKLRATELSDVQATLLSLVSKLNDAIEQDTINSTLSEMAEAAGSADYIRLYSLISILGGLLNSRGLAVAAAELAQLAAIVSDDTSSQLAELVAELKDLIKAVNSSESGTLSAQVNALSTSVKAEIDNGTESVKENITNAVNSLRIAFITDFKAKLNSIVTSLEDCIGNLNKDTPIKGLINTLNGLYDGATDGSQVKKVVEAIQTLITTRNSWLSKVSRVSYKTWYDTSVESYDTSVESFIQSAIISVWQKNITDRLTELLTKIEAVFNTTISGGLNNFENGIISLEALLNTSNSKVNVTETLLNNINASAFMKLFVKLKTVLSVYDQNKRNKDLITELSDLIEDSSALTSAISNINNNYIISTLIADWQSAADVIEKQQVQKILKEELSKVIDTDTLLLSVISDILCPNITKLEATLDQADEFYSNIIAAIEEVKAEVLQKEAVTSTSIADDTVYLELLKSADFKTYLRTDFSKPTLSWLHEDFTTAVDEIKEKLTIILADTDVIKLFNINANTTSTTVAEMLELVENAELVKLLESLKEDLQDLENTATIAPGYEDVFRTLRLEEQLLTDISEMDVNKDFYYSVSVEDRLAIEFNDSDKRLNTLMNPLLNYDINNINNSFVISKLDIDYVDKGIQIARSSRLS